MPALLHNEVMAQAVVDPGAFEVADRIHTQAFVVTCFGQLEGGDLLHSKSYDIAAADETHAAFEALSRYVTEQSRVN